MVGRAVTGRIAATNGTPVSDRRLPFYHVKLPSTVGEIALGKLGGYIRIRFLEAIVTCQRSLKGLCGLNPGA
jgi:hypothetical protein